jgi:hypothetical protein
MDDFSTFARALPAAPLAGPTTGSDTWLASLKPFIDGAPRLGVVTVHRYPLQLCFVSPDSPGYPTIPNLLAAASTSQLADSVATDVELAHARGVPLRVDEMNTIGCGIDLPVSQSLASALWALDSLFEMARVHVDGVNIHTFPGSGSQLFTFTRAGGQWLAHVEPEYYGMLMFAQAAPAGSQLLRVASSPGDPLHQWATRDPDGLIHTVLINFQPAHAATVAVRLPGPGTVTLSMLRAASIGSQSGLTLGDQSFAGETTTGVLVGRSTTALLSPVDGRYVVRVPPATATMLTFTPAG